MPTNTDRDGLNEAFTRAAISNATPHGRAMRFIVRKVCRMRGIAFEQVDFNRFIPADLSPQGIITNLQAFCDQHKVRLDCGRVYDQFCEEVEKEREQQEKERMQQILRNSSSLKQMQAEQAAEERRVYFELKVKEALRLSDAELLREVKRQFELPQGVKLARYLATDYLFRHMKVITDFRTDAIKVYDDVQRYYRETGAERIKALLTKEIGLNNTKTTAEEILHLLRTRSYIYDEEAQKAAPLNLIPLKNGIYDLDTGRLLPHDPKYFFDFQIPVDYIPTAACPQIEKFIGEIVDEHDRSIIYDIFGLALYRVNYLEKFFVLTGTGANGKSKLLSLLQHFIGQKNHSSVTLKQLTEDRFAVARTYKKLVNVGADIGGQPIEDTAILKSACSTDRISGQFKFGQIFDFVPSATLVFSANHPPVFLDDSDGMYRRVETIVFPHTFGNERDMLENPNCRKADPSILEKITTPEELSGLLNIALAHLKTILTTGQLSIVKSTTELKVDYMKYSNSVQAFVEECCEEADYTPTMRDSDELISASGYLTIKEMYGQYLEFCKVHKLPPKSKEGFSKRLKALSSWNLELGLKDGSGSQKERSVRGIAWKQGAAPNPADRVKPSKPTFPIFNRTRSENEYKKEVGGSGFAGFFVQSGLAELIEEVVEPVSEPAQRAARLQAIRDTILAECIDKPVDFSELCRANKWDYDEAWKLAELLKSVGDLIEPRPGFVQRL